MTHPSLGKLEMTHPSLERLENDSSNWHTNTLHEVRLCMDGALVIASSLRNTEKQQILSVWSLQAFLRLLGRFREMTRGLIAIQSPEHLFNLNDKEHPQIPRFSYNFQPPTASAQEPVASMLIEEAGAGVEEPDLSSRESSMSIEFDFGSTEDHIMR